MKYLSKSELYKLLNYKELIEQMKGALCELNADSVVVPQRIHLDSDLFKSTYLFMPVLSEKLKKVAFKYVGVCSENFSKGIPAINGFVMLADAETGIPEMFFDGASLTAIRTGAVGGAAVNLLSKKDAKVLAVFGTGPQSETQIYATLSVRDIKKIYVYYRNREKAEKFVKNILRGKDIDIELVADKKLLEEADIITTATNSKIPVFDSRTLNFKTGVHINAIGSFKPDMQEVDENVYALFDIFADSKSGCIKESGDIINALEKRVVKKNDIQEIGEFIMKNINFDMFQDKKTIFKSVGNAVFDLYTSFYFYKMINKNKT